MKKVIAFLMSACLAFSVMPSAFAQDEPFKESFEHDVKIVSEKTYNEMKPDYYTLDLRPYVTRAFADDVAGDNAGGWTDQGNNDMSEFTYKGITKFLNVPFDIIDPATNNNKSALIMAGQGNFTLPQIVEVPVNDYAGGFYALHSNAWNNGDKVGSYTFVYEDGSESEFNVVAGQHITNWVSVLDNDYTRTAWKGANKELALVTLNIFPLQNPHPEKKIAKLRIYSVGIVMYFNIVAITMVRQAPCLPMVYNELEASIKASGVETWEKYSLPNETQASKSVLNASAYLDAPAGKHGAVSVNDDKFVFEDGTNAKFWGTNIVGDACYPDKELAQTYASAISRSGYSMVRFNGLDKGELTDEKLEKLAYFVSLLKEYGVYSYFSLLSQADGDGDDISTGWKIEGIFDDELIDKQKDFISKLFTYKNPYTDLTFAEDPAVALVDLTDRNTIFSYKNGISDFTIKSEKYSKKFQDKFNAWLKIKYSTTKNLKKAWSSLDESESLEKSTVKINGSWRYLLNDTKRVDDIYKFFVYLEKNYYTTLKDALLNVGYKGPLSGTTNTWDNIMTASTFSEDYTDFNTVNAMASKASYPNVTKLYDNMYYHDTDNQVLYAGSDGKSFIDIMENKVAGKPNVLSQWGAGFINPHSHQNAILTSSICAQQNITPIQFSFVEDTVSDKLTTLYETYTNPVFMSMTYGTAALYYSMQELNQVANVNVNKSEILKDNTLLNGMTPSVYVKDDKPRLPTYLSKKTSVMISNAKTTKQVPEDTDRIIKNENMYWDMPNGLYMAKTPKAVGICGRFKKQVDYGGVSFCPISSASSMVLASMDNKPIKESDTLILAVASRAINTNMLCKATVINTTGEAPVIYMPIVAKFDIELPDDNYDVFALDSNGNRIEQLFTEYKNGKLSFRTNEEATRAINFEISRRGELEQ